MKFQLFACHWMPEGEIAGPKGDFAMIFIETVLPVAHQWVISGGELGPDLMGSTGAQANPDFGHGICLAQCPIIQYGFLDTLRHFLHHIGFPFWLVAKKQVGQSALRFQVGTMDDGLIFFFGILLLPPRAVIIAMLLICSPIMLL